MSYEQIGANWADHRGQLNRFQRRFGTDLASFRGFGSAQGYADPAVYRRIHGAGLLFVAVLPLVRSTIRSKSSGPGKLLLWIVVAGVLIRLVQFAGEPLLEDDYHRYLWDGAVTAEDGNPYNVCA